VAQADRVASVLSEPERPWLLAAAYLHDIGYAPDLVATGLHAIDGALWLRAQRHDRLARLVAHHTGARFEARLRGFGAAIAGFEHEQPPTDDALTYSDLTTSPTGARVSVEQRLAEIERRYGDGQAVSVAMRPAAPSLLEAVRRTEVRLAGALR
jgi:HD domain